MSGSIKIYYKGAEIANIDTSASASKTLLTAGKYCEADIVVDYTADPGNLIDVFGYTDGIRISTSDGGNRTKAGSTTIEYITLADYVQNGTVSFHITGAQFIHKSSPWDDNAYGFYNASKSFTTGGYMNSGTHGSISVTITTESDTDLTITITGLAPEFVTGDYSYMRMCGIGSGADIDIRNV